MSLPNHKQMRLPNYDYNQNGAYFVTICTKNKEKLLGQVVGYGVYDIPFTKLFPYGEIPERYLTLMNEKYDYIFIDKYVIMPNHIHLIIIISSKNNVLGSSIKLPTPTNELIPMFFQYSKDTAIVNMVKIFGNVSISTILFVMKRII